MNFVFVGTFLAIGIILSYYIIYIISLISLLSLKNKKYNDDKSNVDDISASYQKDISQQQLQRQQSERIQKIKSFQLQTDSINFDDTKTLKLFHLTDNNSIDVFGDGCVKINICTYGYYRYIAILDSYFSNKPKSSCCDKVKNASSKQIFKYIRTLLCKLETSWGIYIHYLKIGYNAHVYSLDINERKESCPDFRLSINSTVLDLLIGETPFYLKLGRNFFYEIESAVRRISRLKSRRLAKRIMKLIHKFAKQEILKQEDGTTTSLSDYLKLKKYEFLQEKTPLQTKISLIKEIKGLIYYFGTSSCLSEKYDFHTDFDLKIQELEREINRIETSDDTISIKDKIKNLMSMLKKFTLIMTVHIEE
jgi:hypothetical protein